jgi:hypothetical protein
MFCGENAQVVLFSFSRSESCERLAIKPLKVPYQSPGGSSGPVPAMALNLAVLLYFWKSSLLEQVKTTRQHMLPVALGDLECHNKS